MTADALLMVDVQVGFVSGPAAVPGAEPLVVALADVLRRARAAGCPVVQLRNDGAPGCVDEPGGPGWALRFVPAGDEPVLGKGHDDGFRDTGLLELLRTNGVRRPMVAGLMSEMCVSATARTAMDLGFSVVLPHDCHATYDIPAAPGFGPAVPAAVVSRVAEWALGDAIVLVPTAADVRFVPSALFVGDGVGGPDGFGLG